MKRMKSHEECQFLPFMVEWKGAFSDASHCL